MSLLKLTLIGKRGIKLFVFDKNCTMNVSFDVGISYEPIRDCSIYDNLICGWDLNKRNGYVICLHV